MTRRRKPAPSRKRRRSAQPEEGALESFEIADRLYDVMAELAAISGAVAGSELGGLEQSGVQMILSRQIDEIKTLKNIIHPPDAELSSP